MKNTPPTTLDLKTAFVSVFVHTYQLDKYPKDFEPSIIHLYDDSPECANIPLAHLLVLQNCKEPQISKNAQARLDQISAQQLAAQPISAQSRICLQGRSPRSSADVKQQLSQLNIKTTNALGKKNTHILIGGFLADTQIEKILTANLPIVTPRQLEKFLQTQNLFFLQPQDKTANNHTEIQNLSSLFASFDPANAYIALQILKNNGVPQELITDLFIVAKSKIFPAGHRLFAKKLLQLHAPADLHEHLHSNLILDHHAASPLTIRHLFKNNILDPHKIIRFLKSFPVAKNYTETAYLELLPLQEQHATLRRLAALPNYTLALSGLSTELANWICQQNIFRRINANSFYALFREDDFNLFAATELEFLSFSAITRDTSQWFPKFIAFKKLHTLELKHCLLPQFPDVFYAMPQLREINLQNNFIDPINPQTINGDIYDMETYARTKILYRY